MELGDLRELLYAAHNRFFSIQVTWQYWYRVDIMNEALEKWAAQHPPGSVSALKSKSAQGTQSENEMKIRWRVWWQKPSCWRDEHQIEGQGNTIRIICEDRWWFFASASSKLYTNVAPQEKSPHLRIHKSKSPLGAHLTRVEDALNEVPLLDPSFLLASHDLQPMESTVYAEQEAVRVRAVFRKGKDVARDPFFWGAADEYELLVAKEQGILLRYAAKLRGQEFAIASVDHVVFDEPIPESVFSFTPPANTSVEIVS